IERMTTAHPLTQNIRPGQPPLDIHAYERAGGYQALRKALKEFSPSEITEEVKKAGLRGRGGAGFPTGVKWSLLPPADKSPRPRYLIANTDEMEPGTFKDRILLVGDPHLFLEGLIIGAYANQAEIAYIFLRAEYVIAAGLLERAIAEAYGQHYLG